MIKPPVVILYDANGNPHAVRDGVAIPANTPALLAAGSDGTNAKYLSIDSSTGALRTTTVQSGTVGTRVEGRFAQDTTNDPYPVVLGGRISSSGILKTIAVDSEGRIIIAPAGSTSSVAGFAMGYVFTTNPVEHVVRATTYNEPSSNAQRSIRSSSANDAAAGTGLRSLRLTYYDATGAGPYTEDITLNGTTAVNTVASNICYIESIVGLTAGSGGVNAGTITLYSTTGGGGTAVGTISVGDNRTFWSHHYTPTGKSTHITSLSTGHNGTTVGSGGIFYIRAITLGVSNAVERQISDFVRLYGQSSTISRNYGTAIEVSGPARTVLYVLAESAADVVFRGAFDFYDQDQ